jgi:hypothetical protein
MRKQVTRLIVAVILPCLLLAIPIQANAGGAGMLLLMMNKKLKEEREKASTPEVEPDGFMMLFEWVMGDNEIRICGEEEGKTIISKSGGCYERKMEKSNWSGTNTFKYSFVNDGISIQDLIDKKYGESVAKLIKVDITGVGSSKSLMAFYKFTNGQ